jgi:hypothetical protein
MMPSDIWNALGALLITTALLAAHPIRPATAERISDQILVNWNEMAREQGCEARGDESCAMLPIAMPLSQN